MTKKDFELIARVIQKLNFKTDNRKFIAERFADELSSTNARFDRERFIKAAMS